MLPNLTKTETSLKSVSERLNCNSSFSMLPKLYTKKSCVTDNTPCTLDKTINCNNTTLANITSPTETPKPIRFAIVWKGVDFCPKQNTKSNQQSKQKSLVRSCNKKLTQANLLTRASCRKNTTRESAIDYDACKVPLFKTPPSRKPIHQVIPKFVTAHRLSKKSRSGVKTCSIEMPTCPNIEESIVASSEDLGSDMSTSFFDYSREEHSPIVSSLGSNEVAENPHFRNRLVHDEIPELRTKPSGSVLLMEYAKAKVAGKLDSLTPNTRINEFLINAIHKNFFLRRLFSQENAYPSDIRSLVFRNKEADKGELMQAMSTDAYSNSYKEWDLFFYTTLRCKYHDLLHEISSTIPEFDYFYKELFMVHVASTSVNDNLKEETNMSVIKKTIADFKLFIAENSSCEKIRQMVGDLIRTAEVNPALRSELVIQAPEWLSFICYRLTSRLKTDRDCICTCIVLVITSTEICWELLNHRYVDIAFDLVKVLIRAIGICGDSFGLYYSTLGFVLHCCHSLSVLDGIMDSAPNVSNLKWQKIWPYLITCALRHWDKKHFSGYNVFQRKLAENLKEAAAKHVSKKNAKVALQTLSQKFKMDVDLVTVVH